jgi:sirohydrochlorin cobaltochelatase
VPTDFNREHISELKSLEQKREHEGREQMCEREAELDRLVRDWPRTEDSDPYKTGLEAVGRALAPRLAGRRLELAYNEFCAPSPDEVIDRLVADGTDKISLLTTMFTRGGSHSEVEIPALVERARQRHPGVRIDYSWPYDLELVADLLAGQLELADHKPG